MGAGRYREKERERERRVGGREMWGERERKIKFSQ